MSLVVVVILESRSPGAIVNTTAPGTLHARPSSSMTLIFNIPTRHKNPRGALGDFSNWLSLKYTFRPGRLLSAAYLGPAGLPAPAKVAKNSLLAGE